ncbi:MAG TPA: HAMP domain-containing sensor histidine kinase [Roseiflexaceae bacterium]|nr:HAMP domain-containing sensor histidine kinase [Roseiflexaceae bacterium]
MSEPESERIPAMASLYPLAVALAAALSPAEVASAALKHGGAAVGAAAGAVVALAGDGNMLEVLDTFGYPGEHAASPQLIPLAARAPAADALHRREPVLLGSREALAARYPELAAAHSYAGQQAWATLPLLLPDRAVGVLELSFATPRAFSGEERGLLAELAQLCARALARAGVYEAERRAHTDAEAAVQLRDHFLSLAAHDLKTPLTALIGQAQLLRRRMQREGMVDARHLHSLDIVVSQAGRLNRMVSALLDFARIEQGRLRIECTSLDLGALVRQAIEDLQGTLASHSLIFDQEDAGGLSVEGDAPRLEQVIRILVGNAVTYSPGGGTVLVRAERGGATARLLVIDRGIGVPASDLPHLGTRFYRAANAGAAHGGGMGIGLYVAREIISQHGGTIAIASEEGVGTTVTVELPLRSDAEGPGRSAHPAR